MQDFKNVKVWQKAHELALLVYQMTFDFPKEEMFGLRSLLRKTVVEIPAKIAQGCNAAHDNDFMRYQQSAFSYAGQLEYYFLLARDLQMFSEAEYKQLNDKIIEVKKMLNNFMKRLTADN